MIGEVSSLSLTTADSDRPNCYARTEKLETVPFILSLKDPLWRIGSTPAFVWLAFQGHGKRMRLNSGYRISEDRISRLDVHNWHQSKLLFAPSQMFVVLSI